MTTTDELAALVGKEAAGELNDALEKIQHCVGQLNDDQVWQRPQAGMNSIANLLLHLAGNLQQWIVCGLGGETDRRNRPAEFAAEGGLARDELLGQLSETVRRAAAVLTALDGENLARKRVIQAFEVTGAGAMFSSVAHFRGHTQEIIHLTRRLMGEGYQVHWEPKSQAEGAP